MQTAINIILWLSMGGLTAYFAKQRGRDPTIWFFLGMLLGLIGVICLFILPNLQAQALEEEPEQLDPFKDIPASIRFQDWFYLDQQRQQIGPLSFEHLLSDWKEGILVKDSYVWNKDMTDWQRVSALPDLLSALS